MLVLVLVLLLLLPAKIVSLQLAGKLMSSKLAALVQRPHAADAVKATGFAAILPRPLPLAVVGLLPKPLPLTWP